MNLRVRMRLSRVQSAEVIPLTSPRAYWNNSADDTKYSRAERPDNAGRAAAPVRQLGRRCLNLTADQLMLDA